MNRPGQWAEVLDEVLPKRKREEYHKEQMVAKQGKQGKQQGGGDGVTSSGAGPSSRGGSVTLESHPEAEEGGGLAGQAGLQQEGVAPVEAGEGLAGTKRRREEGDEE